MTATELTTVRDRADIADLCARYAVALDSADWALLRTCFADDAEVVYGDGPPLRGPHAVEEVCRGALDPLDASQHLVGTVLVDVDGDDATSTCYLHAQHVRHGTPGGDTFVVAGTYRDRLRRRPDGWRIVHRTLEVTWTAGNPDVLSAPTATTPAAG